MRVAPLGSLVVLALLAAGCDEPGPTAATAADLTGRWQLVSLQSTDGSVMPAEAGRFFVEFTESRLMARADCNSCTGSFAVAPDRLTISLLACTRAFCASPLANPFVEHLQSATTAHISAAGLRLNGPSGQLVFGR